MSHFANRMLTMNTMIPNHMMIPSHSLAILNTDFRIPHDMCVLKDINLPAFDIHSNNICWAYFSNNLLLYRVKRWIGR